jgi:quinol monooxygenase YgiN
MGKTTMMGSFECQEGRAEAMEAVLERMVRAAADEPGCEIYSYHRGEGNTFWFFALMTDQASMQVHGQSEGMKAAMAEFMPLVAGPPKMSMSRPIAALGLDL